MTDTDANPIYQVVDWNEHFENNRTRNLDTMRWVPIPNSHDGDGYTELMDDENGPENLAAWLLIVQVASKCHERGTLMRKNAPHTPKTLARITGAPVRIFENAIPKLLEIGWLQAGDVPNVSRVTPETSVAPHPTDYGREGKGIEEKEEEGDSASQLNSFISECKKINPSFERCKDHEYLQVIRAWPEADLSEALQAMRLNLPGGEVPRPMQTLGNYLRRSHEKMGGKPTEATTEKKRMNPKHTTMLKPIGALPGQPTVYVSMYTGKPTDNDHNPYTGELTDEMRSMMQDILDNYAIGVYKDPPRWGTLPPQFREKA